MDIENHLLTNSKFLKSPNFSERKDSIDLIIIHCISLPQGSYANNNVADFFLNKLNFNDHVSFESLRNIKVSAHLYIDRSGEVIQFVPFDKCAWHAGKSEFMGKKNCNDFSIGIELEGTVNQEYEDIQYRKLKEIVDLLIKQYEIKHVVGHKDVAPNRKLDPGTKFDWGKILSS